MSCFVSGVTASAVSGTILDQPVGEMITAYFEMRTTDHTSCPHDVTHLHSVLEMPVYHIETSLLFLNIIPTVLLSTNTFRNGMFFIMLQQNVV
jgi:hypothetical protein